MDEISLQISNPSNATYKSILLRKFFLMLFIDADGKKIHAYIASVFGGLQGTTDENAGTQQRLEALLPVRYDPKDECYLMFKISSDSGLIDSVNFEDKTKSFCNQPKWVTKVWGENHRCEDKSAVKDHLQELYESRYNGSLPFKVDSGAPIYFFSEDNRPFHSFLAAEGRYEKSDGFQYRLLVPKDQGEVAGIEAINWIKADISLKSDLRNHPISFSIKFDGKFYTPDFTWYLAPPAGYIVNEESSIKVNGIGTDKNAISAVSDETDVLFKEWKDERIMERRKSRVLLNAVSGCDVLNLSKHEKLTVHLHIANPQGTSNRQFILGLLVAFLLSFCSDKTRINDYYSCLLSYCTCADKTEDYCSKCSLVCNAISVAAPALILLAFLVWVLDPKRCFPRYSAGASQRGQCILGVMRIIGIFLTIALAGYVFVVWLLWPDLLGFMGCDWNNGILTIGFSIAFVINLVYLIYCLCYLKRSITNYL